MAQGECKTTGCERAGQISGAMEGYCCWRCGVDDPDRHTELCGMIEEAGRADIAEDDRTIVLGYN